MSSQDMGFKSLFRELDLRCQYKGTVVDPGDLTEFWKDVDGFGAFFAFLLDHFNKSPPQTDPTQLGYALAAYMRSHRFQPELPKLFIDGPSNVEKAKAHGERAQDRQKLINKVDGLLSRINKDSTAGKWTP
ncbi:hypothetical protein BGX23_004612, partial [Mortierella sp. AD031]